MGKEGSFYHSADARGGSPPGRISRAQERKVKQEGVLLASAGLILALAALAYYRFVALTETPWSAIAALGGVTAIIQLILWFIPRQGWDRHLQWDSDYVRLPLLAAGLLLFSYAAFVPEGRYLMLIGWFAALLFGLRFLNFKEVIQLGVLATGLYVLGLVLHLDDASYHNITWRSEGGLAAVLLAVHVFVAGVFERVRREREKRLELRQQLVEESVTDPLTGLRNRRYLERFLETEVARANRYDASFSVAMADLDHFKVYNDTHGHPAGDRVLETVAEILRSEAREADVVARYGGEEFIQVMPETGLAGAREKAERIREAVEEWPFPGEGIMPEGVTVSLGVASIPEHEETADELVQAADEALYQAKEAGRNRVMSAAALESSN